MIIREMGLAGLRVIEPERHEDERGFFARTFSRAEFVAAGLAPVGEECSISFNRERGTLRGMHFQREPIAEDKLVRCTRGRIWDVAVDARPASETFGRWVAAELDEEKGWALYIPRGFAHGFITLEPSTEVFYQCSPRYEAAAAAGFRWDDPDVGIDWPLEPLVVSARDRGLPFLRGLASPTRTP
jgi:dTDP-4-dehydrorhamnose 3,5-epimerase